MVQILSNGTVKTKLAMLAFLYYGEFVKNPSGQIPIHFVDKVDLSDL